MPNDTMSRNVYFRGSGGLYSTAEDYLPLGIMLAGGGEMNAKRLLSRKTVEMMSAAHIPDTLQGRPAGEGYGLSVRVVTNHAARGTMLSDGTFGWTGAQGTHFFVDPKEELTAVLMVQTSNGEIQRDFEDLGRAVGRRLVLRSWSLVLSPSLSRGLDQGRAQCVAARPDPANSTRHVLQVSMTTCPGPP
jgi:CubicO group peptidase (beta-lactamase class C family)